MVFKTNRMSLRTGNTGLLQFTFLNSLQGLNEAKIWSAMGRISLRKVITLSVFRFAFPHALHSPSCFMPVLSMPLHLTNPASTNVPA